MGGIFPQWHYFSVLIWTQFKWTANFTKKKKWLNWDTTNKIWCAKNVRGNATKADIISPKRRPALLLFVIFSLLFCCNEEGTRFRLWFVSIEFNLLWNPLKVHVIYIHNSCCYVRCIAKTRRKKTDTIAKSYPLSIYCSTVEALQKGWRPNLWRHATQLIHFL